LEPLVANKNVEVVEVKRVFLVMVLLTLLVVVGLAAKYTFYFISHIGPSDPNMKWLTVAIEDIEKILPVEVRYFAPKTFSIKAQVDLLKTAIAANPDGLIVPITDPNALDEPLREAIAKGIPVIAANIPDPRPEDERIPYLTYVGGDEYLTGVFMGKELLKTFGDKKPKRVAVGLAHVGHVGAEMRAQGMIDVLKPLGIPVDKIALTDDPAKIMQTWQAYLTAHPDTEAIWLVTLLATPYVVQVNEQMGRGDVKVFTVDESPLAIEGIRAGKVVATHSQQFYLQGWLPTMWLYIYNEYGYTPPPQILTGPVIINRENADEWREKVIKVFGEDLYNQLGSW